ncbi:hypothetical protein FHX37_0889 [Haloactinospora alba]|uniref:N-acetyltransferase domain-containing protein n=1 Tax=Haloactinospora alba TaxID=405555 RepID=A0A543NGX5_9ACTN|nr:GNAT family N-acetyltransferase [Haloactinospora alba]TQN31000.1 hypothetical protein FHX37_0889 [Haloactinospora alba]
MDTTYANEEQQNGERGTGANNTARTDVREASPQDIDAIVELGGQRRERYQRHAARPWSPVADARNRHRTRLEELVDDPRSVALVAVRDGKLRGYLCCTLVTPPDLYEPGGPVGRVEDFAVSGSREWTLSAQALFAAVRRRLRESGAVSVLVTTDGCDSAERAFLWRMGMSLESEQYRMSVE